MKLIFKEDKLILYLNTSYINDINLTNKEELSKYIKNLLFKLSENYSLEFNGYYNINIYLDKNYGLIIEITLEDNLYLDYFSDTLDINIKIYKDSFLYEVSDIDDISDINIYLNNNHIYIELLNPYSNILMGKFMEKVISIKYGLEKKKIIKNSKVLRW